MNDFSLHQETLVFIKMYFFFSNNKQLIETTSHFQYDCINVLQLHQLQICNNNKLMLEIPPLPFLRQFLSLLPPFALPHLSLTFHPFSL